MKMEYFQLIDRIETVGLDPLRLTAKADVPAESTIFEGHFPGYPIMPGVLLIETMAQAAGFCLLWNNCFKKMPFLVAVKSVKLRNFVPPSSSLDVLCEVEHEGSGYAYSRTSIHNEGKLICDAQLGMKFLEFPSPELLDHIKAQAHRIDLPERASLE